MNRQSHRREISLIWFYPVAMFSKDDAQDGAITKSGDARGDWLVMSAIFVAVVMET